MKKILSIAIITICMFGFGLNVFAAATCVPDSNASTENYKTLKNKYIKFKNIFPKEIISLFNYLLPLFTFYLAYLFQANSYQSLILNL